jgi:hypothetical protein
MNQPEAESRKEVLAFESGESTIAPCEHEHGGHAETHGKKNKHGNMIERIFDDHECGAPKERAERRRQIGFGAAGFVG